jgi:hypothetical protein
MSHLHNILKLQASIYFLFSCPFLLWNNFLATLVIYFGHTEKMRLSYIHTVYYCFYGIFRFWRVRGERSILYFLLGLLQYFSLTLSAIQLNHAPLVQYTTGCNLSDRLPSPFQGTDTQAQGPQHSRGESCNKNRGAVNIPRQKIVAGYIPRQKIP